MKKVIIDRDIGAKPARSGLLSMMSLATFTVVTVSYHRASPKTSKGEFHLVLPEVLKATIQIAVADYN